MLMDQPTGDITTDAALASSIDYDAGIVPPNSGSVNGRLSARLDLRYGT